MIEKSRGHVESASVVKQVRPGLSECLIQIDFSEYVIFYDPMVLMSYINHDVTYLTRPDIINGVEREVICEIALISEVVALPATENTMKLVPVDVKRPVCNFNIKDVKFGEFKPKCVGLLTKIALGESPRASWFDCDVLDAYGHMFKLRIFMKTSEVEKMSEYEAMVNGYIEFDIESTKYGFQTSEISAMSNKVEESPEIAIARDVVLKYVQSDSLLNQMFTELDISSAFTNFVDTEPGYIWVRIASELYFIDTIDNTTSGINTLAMKRATICTRLFTLVHKYPWSHNIINVTKLSKFKELTSDEDLREIVDVYYDKAPSDTKLLYYKVRGIVANIIDIRRGLQNEENSRNVAGFISDNRNMFNGLL